MIKILFTILFMLLSNCSYGAEFLVITKDSGHWSNAKNGDIIAIRENGYKWSDKEKSGLFKVIKKPEMKYADAKKYTESMEEEDMITKKTSIVRDRKYYFDGDTIKAKVLSTEKLSVISEKALIDIKEIDAK